MSGSGVPGEGFNNRQVQIIAVCTTCVTLSTLAVGLRLLVRRVASSAHTWWDDWFTVVALVMSWLVNIFTLLGLKDGLGRHVTEVNHSHLVPFNISVWAQQITWVLSMGLIIIAILLFYLRIFPNKWMRLAVHAIGAFMIAWTISSLIVIICQCTPVNFFWDRGNEGGHCINANAFYFAIGLISTIVMVSVLFLPLPIIWHLHVSTTKKLGLAFSFTLGVFVCVSSIIRLVVLLEIKKDDLMYTSSLPQLWSCVEVSFGVISACVPSLTPLFLFFKSKIPSPGHKYASSYGPHGHRSNRNAKSHLNRLAKFGEFGESDIQSTSLELIMRHPDGNPAIGAERASRMGLTDGDIVVTKQINQTSRERLEGTEAKGSDAVQYQAAAGV